jgi:flagellar basal-body rod protein FlgB
MAISSVMGLAQLKAEWLSQRQELLSQNVANVNTPGFKSRDLVGFSDVIQSLNSSSSNSVGSNAISGFRSFTVASSESLGSGNAVSLETEMLKLNETNSQYSLSTNIIKSFHRMISSSLKI